MRKRSNHHRKGLTLLEVVIGLAIFLVSLAAITQLLTVGRDRAVEIRLESRTSLRCQAKMAEIVVGAEALGNGGGYAPFSDDFDKDLQWRMESTPAEAEGLWMVRVWVKADLPGGKIVESTLSQMVLDPSIRGTTFDQPLPVAIPSTGGGG
jgi:prepilin-type N-terminal cleavage/methylation domain-containing protein